MFLRNQRNEEQRYPTTGMKRENELRQVEEASGKRTHFLGCHLQEMSRRGKKEGTERGSELGGAGSVD